MTVVAKLAAKIYNEVKTEIPSVHVETYLSRFGLPFTNSQGTESLDSEKKAHMENMKFNLLSGVLGSTQHRNLQIAVTTVMAMVQGAIAAYESITRAFKTIKNSTIKAEIAGKGYTKWTDSSRLLKSEGIPEAYYP